LNVKEFENRWKSVRRTSRSNYVHILDKTRSIMFIADDYFIYSDSKVQLVYLYNNGRVIGYIDPLWIYIVN